MKSGEVIKSIFFSWDWILAVFITIVVSFLIPAGMPPEIAKEIFSIGIAILSIIFSIFFAALAILITAGDNQFVAFLEQEGQYTKIVWTFKYTLLLLFIALLLSIVLFVTVLPITLQENPDPYPKLLIIFFSILALYALFATVQSSLSIIKYAEVRAKYLEIAGDEE